MASLKSSSDVIDKAGGTAAFAQWWGVDLRRVSDWRKRGFPAELILVMRARLRNEKGIDAAPSCWGVRDPAESKRRTRALSAAAG
jgi:hypothetical protein